MKKLFIFVIMLTASLSLSTNVFAADDEDAASLPRFVSVRENPARMRTGPDTRYPIKWIYKKAGAPLKVILEMDSWRKVKDWEGSEGWMNKSLLSNRRTFRITGIRRALRTLADEKAPIVAYLNPGVFGSIEKCPKNIDYCKVKVDKYTGWLPRDSFWGLLPNEEIE